MVQPIDIAAKLLYEAALAPLARGYAELVAQCKADAALIEAVRTEGLEAALHTPSQTLNTLQKNNKELVTGAEKQAEAALRAALSAHFPEDGLLGEEHGYQAKNGTLWVIDPVDGTSAMIRTALADAADIAAPEAAFGITLARIEKNHATQGIVLELRAANEGLTAGKIFISNAITPAQMAARSLEEAVLCCTVPEIMFHTQAAWGGFQALADRCRQTKKDLNCMGYMQLLSQEVDIVYEADLAYHDAAALVPILQAAGIKVTDENGQAPDFSLSRIGKPFSLLAASPDLHAKALTCVKAGVPDDKNRFNPHTISSYTQKF